MGQIGWLSSHGPSGQKPILPWEEGTVLRHKNKPLSDKKWVTNMAYIQQQPLKHI